MYDNTYHFIPTQGWMFLPLVVYHGGKEFKDRIKLIIRASAAPHLTVLSNQILCMYKIGGAEAMFEPLSDNYDEYEWGLAQYFGYGVQACYRGFR